METVKSCVFLKDWAANGRSGKVYTVTLTDGTTGQSFMEIPAGTNASELEIADSQYGNKVKWNKPNKGGFVAKRSGNESFALSYAKDLVVADKVKIDQILPIADKLFNWLESKKQ